MGILDDMKRAFDPNRNGINRSLEKTKQDIEKSNEKIKNDIDQSNKSIGETLQRSLEKTKENVDMGKLQEANGVISKIVSVTPIGFLAMEGINIATKNESNKYLNGNGSSQNPLLNAFGNVFNQVLGIETSTKQMEEINPFPKIFQDETPVAPQPVDNFGYSEKYSFLDNTSGEYDKGKYGKPNNLKWLIIGTGGGLLFLLIIAKKLKNKIKA